MPKFSYFSVWHSHFSADCRVPYEAAIFEIGEKNDCEKDSTDHWSIFDIDDRQLTFKGLKYERREESTLKPKVWVKLLEKNEPFTGEHSEICCSRRALRVKDCSCVKGEPFDTGPWTMAAELLEREGHEEAARELRFNREKLFHKWEREEFWKDRQLEMIPNLFWKHLIALFIGYGFKPYKAIVHAFAGIFLAFALGVVAIECNLIAPLSGGEFVTGSAGHAYLEFDPVTFAFDAFLPILDSPQTAYWQSTSLGLDWAAGFEWAVRAISFWGWLTFAFGAISFTSLVKRT